MQKLKKFLTIILISLVLIGFVAQSYCIVEAQTGQTAAMAGDTIAAFALDFYEKHRLQAVYEEDPIHTKMRETTYTYDCSDDDLATQYIFDCVGFVSYVYYHAVGYGYKEFTYFATPQSGVYGNMQKINTDSDVNTAIDNGGIIPGDIIVMNGHVSIYVGDGKTIGMCHNKYDEHGNDLAGLTYTDANNDVNNIGGGYQGFVARIPEEEAQKLDFTYKVGNPSNVGQTGKLNLPIDKVTIDLDQQTFAFSGTPQKMSYAGKTKFKFWHFNSISEFIDYLMGILTAGLKASILGWGIAGQLIIDNLINAAQGNSSEENTSYTIEDVLFNRVPLLDANFFKDTAGGQPIKEGSASAVLRSVVAGWYVSFRNLSVVVISIILIYYGIRMIISNAVNPKADLKKTLLIWLKAMILLFVLNYIIYLVLNLNDMFLEMIRTSTIDNTSYFELIKTRAYDIRFSIGIPALILYLTMIIFWIRFVLEYISRLFKIAIYIAAAPLVVAKYAYDGATGKESRAYANWFKKFSVQVFSQSVQALVYVVFVTLALQLSQENVMGFILALIFLNFMLSSDEIFLSIFNFDDMGGDIHENKKGFKEKKDKYLALFITYDVTKKAIGMGAGVAGGTVRGVSRVAKNTYHDVLDDLSDRGHNKPREINDSISSHYKNGLNKIDDLLINKIGDKDNREMGNRKVSNEINRYLRLRKLARNKKGVSGVYARKNLKLKHQEYKKKYSSAFKFIKGATLGSAGVVFAIPMSVVYGIDKGGLAQLTAAVSGFTSASEVLTAHRKAVNTEPGKSSNDKIDKVLFKLEDIDKKLIYISDQVNTLNPVEKNEKIKGLIKYNDTGVSKFSVKEDIDSYKKAKEIKKIDSDNLKDIVEIATIKYGDTLTEEQIEEVKTKAYTYISTNSSEVAEKGYKKEIIVDGINKAIMSKTYGDDKPEIAEALEFVNSANAEELSKKDNLGVYKDTNKFLRDLY